MPSIDPVSIALIGAGDRAQRVYAPLLDRLAPWLRIAAVCDPNVDRARQFASEWNVPAYDDIRMLVKDAPVEAALIVAPVGVHHALSAFLSDSHIHNHVETSMAYTLRQAQDMLDRANRNGVTLTIAENFIRFPADRMARLIMASNFIGPVKRVTCFHDHLGFHNNSRWVAMFGHPMAVNSVVHVMPTVRHRESAHRVHDSETFSVRTFWFPEDRLVTDLSGNSKNLLGRHPRPGYLEIDGTRGSIVYGATDRGDGRGEVRYCSDRSLETDSIADQVFPIDNQVVDGQWVSSAVDLPTGRLLFENPYRDDASRRPTTRAWYGPSVMDHMVDFAYAVRGVGSRLYSAEDGVVATAMEMAAGESAIRGGERVEMPLMGPTEYEAAIEATLRRDSGIDPMDIEAMIQFSFPRQ